MTVPRQRRYAIRGEEGSLREVWFALHGYGQLAHRFLRYLEILDDGTRLLVAPEGLHRYYLDHAERKVGSSWMTSEDRLTDIEDYVIWLDRLYGRVFETVRREEVRVVALGFSQGVHTLCRWLAFGGAAVDVAVVWGAGLPPDLDLEAHAGRLGRPRWFVVAGDADPVFDPESVATAERRLASAGVESRTLRFAGDHRLDRATLERLAAEIGPEPESRR
jgi:predicted esterase